MVKLTKRELIILTAVATIKFLQDIGVAVGYDAVAQHMSENIDDSINNTIAQTRKQQDPLSNHIKALSKILMDLGIAPYDPDEKKDEDDLEN